MMRFALRARARPELPGTAGTARVGRRVDTVLRRLRRGDIAVIDHVDLDRATADALVAAGVAGVVNAAPSISGRYPNLGPEILVNAGVVLVDNVGADALRRIKDGSHVRLHQGRVYAGERLLAEGVEQTRKTVAAALADARVGLAHQLEAFAANTAEFVRYEHQLLLDGEGLPDLGVDLDGKPVVVVAEGHEPDVELAGLRRYIRERRPVLVGVGRGADVLVAAGYRPQVVVGDPSAVSRKALSCVVVVVPTPTDDPGAQLQQVQDLGVRAVPVTSSANPEDLALLLAHRAGANPIVTVGATATMEEFLDRGRSGSNVSTVLTRLRLGGTLVDAAVVGQLYRGSVTAGSVLVLAVAAVLAGTAALSVSAAGDAVVTWLTTVGRDLVKVIAGGVSS